MNLILSKPLAFVDLETTGLDIANDRIVEISILKLNTDGSKTVYTKRINPIINISPESEAIHGISDADVKNEPTFKDLGNEIKNFIGNADLAGFNSNKFDFPLLVEEFYRHSIDFSMSKRKFIDVQNIFHKMEKRTLEAAYRFYCDKALDGAHSAEVDVTATYEVLEAQLSRYGDLEPTASFLHEFSQMNRNVDFAGRIVLDDNDIPIFNFGKHKGQAVHEIFEKKDPSYFNWIMNADFTENTKRVVTELKLKGSSNS